MTPGKNSGNLLPFLKKEQVGVHADVLELPHATVVLLDSGKRGAVEDKQLDWLAQQLDHRKDKPALVFAHYNPLPTHGIRPIRGMKNGKALLKLIATRKHAKAFFHGHTHEWQQSVEGSIHIIAQPPVSYYFGKGHAHGWVDMNLNETTADLELRCIDPVHKQHGEKKQISLKS